MTINRGTLVRHKDHPVDWGIAIVIDPTPGKRNDIHVRIIAPDDDPFLGMDCFWLIENLIEATNET